MSENVEQELEQIAEHPVAAAEAVIEDAIETLEAAPGEVADATAAAIKALELRVEALEHVAAAPAEEAEGELEEELHDVEGEGVPVVTIEEPVANTARTNDSFMRKIHDVLG